MNIDAIQSSVSLGNLQSNYSIDTPISNDVGATSFLELLGEKLNSVNESIATSNSIFERYIQGDAVSVHDVMISMGKAKSELQLVIEVRNKVLEAYQEITRIQV